MHVNVIIDNCTFEENNVQSLIYIDFGDVSFNTQQSKIENQNITLSIKNTIFKNNINDKKLNGIKLVNAILFECIVNVINVIGNSNDMVMKALANDSWNLQFDNCTFICTSNQCGANGTNSTNSSIFNRFVQTSDMEPSDYYVIITMGDYTETMHNYNGYEKDFIYQLEILAALFCLGSFILVCRWIFCVDTCTNDKKS